MYSIDEYTRLKTICLTKLVAAGVIQFGNFTLRNGSTSPVYLDFRRLLSFPNITKLIANLFISRCPEIIKSSIIGIPLGGLNIASAIALQADVPQLLLRKEQKTYGLCKLLEGSYGPSDNIILVDDVITSGTSVKEALSILQKCGIDTNTNVTAILVICERSAESHPFGDKVISLFTLNDFIEYTPKNVKIYENPTFNRLYQLALIKESNIIVACDLHKFESCERLIRLVGSKVVGVKIHADTIDYFNDDVIKRLMELKQELNFIIIEDRKLADIGFIELKQLNTAPLSIGKWADAVTIHGFSGIDTSVMKSIAAPIVIAEMSNDDNLLTPEITRRIFDKYSSSGCAFVCQEVLPRFNKYSNITMSPGIKITGGSDNYGQKYTIPSKGGMFWIVGRGIMENGWDNVEKTMDSYKTLGWNTFMLY